MTAQHGTISTAPPTMAMRMLDGARCGGAPHPLHGCIAGGVYAIHAVHLALPVLMTALVARLPRRRGR